jgi:hypothetical protein
MITHIPLLMYEMSSKNMFAVQVSVIWMFRTWSNFSRGISIWNHVTVITSRRLFNLLSSKRIEHTATFYTDRIRLTYTSSNSPSSLLRLLVIL